MSGRELAEWVSVPLSVDERRRISRRLGADLAGLGLLAVGLGVAWYQPDQAQVGALFQAMGALVVGLPVIVRGLVGLVTPTPRSHTDQLVSLAVLAAMAAGEFATATLVPVLLELGRLFEERSALGAQAAIEGIRGLRVRSASRREGATEVEVPLDALVPGDCVVVRPGDLVPVDGVVRSGRSKIDQSPVTGESKYETVAPGAAVFAGTLNLDGMIEVVVEHVGEGTVLGRVVDLLRVVEGSKVPAIRLLEHYSAAYLPVVLAVAATVLFFSEELDRAITVLVVACPTALVLAGPAAVVAAMTAATRRSILVKSAEFLERMGDVDTLILDKTGTVTEGRQVVRTVTAVDCEDAEVLAAGAIAAEGSLHPVSRAIVEAAAAREVTVARAEETTEFPGLGVEARAAGHTVLVGRRSWLVERGVAMDGAPTVGQGTGAWIARDGVVRGHVALFDRPRDEAPEVIATLRGLGLDRVVLLTGDRTAIAREVGALLGVDEVVAEVLPEGKLDVIRAEQSRGRTVMMVGDGVNDTLALSGADVGVAIGARVNEVALGGADVALMTEDLSRLPVMVELAAHTRGTITGNAILGLAFSVVMVGLASAGYIPPLWGAALHNLGAFLVVGNSARILRRTG